MALIIGGNPMGFFSGKEGGRVYSHNRAGQYTRQYVNPVNPATTAQGDARSTFAGAVAPWHALSAAQKAAWGSFASSTFSPKIGVNNGQFSGFNAYVSMRNLASNGNRLGFAATGLIDGAAPGTAFTFDAFSFSETPPTFALGANIKEQTTGNALSLGIGDVTINDDGSYEFEALIEPGAGGTYDVEDCVDANDIEFGLCLQMSNAKPQSGMFFENPFKYTIGFMKHPTIDSADRTGISSFGVASTSNLNPGDYQDFPIEDDVVRATLWQVSKGGQIALLGSKEVTITGA